MCCQKSPPFPEHSLHFFSLSQSVFALAHWRNTSFHAPQQQCYPLRCEKGETGKNEGDFPYRFLPGSACCKSCGHSKVCKSPCPRQPDRGGTVALGSSQGRHLLSGSPGCGIWQGCHSLLLCGAKPFCSVILHTRLAAQQIQKTSAWRPWGGFCFLNSLGTQQSLWIGLWGQLREAGILAVLLHSYHLVSQRADASSC